MVRGKHDRLECPHDFELDLSFLTPGSYNIQYYQGGVKSEKYGSDYKMIKTSLTDKDKIPIHMASGGDGSLVLPGTNNTSCFDQ